MEVSPIELSPTQDKKRMEWLDAMRGFTMIMVVANHIATKSFDLVEKDSSTLQFLLLFRMPLFFFVSGFLAYKASIIWNGRTLGTSLLKKIRVQIVPTVFFLFVASVMLHRDFWNSFTHAFTIPYKSGYWFTWVLLLMFASYYLFAFIEQKIMKWGKGRIPKWLPITILWLLSIGLYETAYMPKYFTYPKTEWAWCLSYTQYAMYFCFFLTGNICRRYWSNMEKLFDSKWFFPIVTIVCFICCAEFLKWHNLRLMWANLPRTIAIFSLLAIIIMYFRHNERLLSKQTKIGSVLQHIGTRTLDIYLIHYLFLPRIPQLGQWFSANKPNIVLEILSSVGVALLVIAFCCLVSSVLRTSPLLKKYLFGKEDKKPQPTTKSVPTL